MKINKVSAANIDVSDLSRLMDIEKIDYEKISHANWKEYPYIPKVMVRLAYTSDSILINFKVFESSVRAKYTSDNDPVWTDSCVEFFSIPNNDGIYYNIECNCIGTILIGAGKDKQNRERAGKDVTSLVKRWSSLGDKSFDELKEETTWEVSLIVPFKAFFKHNIESLDGKTIKANFYKCGDELSNPHFVSWNPIDNPTPNFHLPEFFADITFVKKIEE